MTVSTTAYATTISGNGATTVFSFSFIADSSSTIKVTLTDVNGVQTVLLSSQYTLFINPTSVGNLWGIGGTVTYPLSGSPLPSTSTITIERIVPYTQGVSIQNQGAFYPQAVEQGLDLLELQLQQLQGQLLNTVRAPTVDGVVDMVLPTRIARANKFLMFNTSGQPVVSLGIPSTTPIGAGSIMFFLSSFASLSAADTAATVVGGILVIDQNVPLLANTTLTTKVIQFGGGVITRGSNNLTLNNVVAGDTMIFDKAGTGTITITKGPVLLSWFGVSRNGITDDTAAINRAIAANKDVYITAGNYFYTGNVIITNSGTNLLGFGTGCVFNPGGGAGVITVRASNVAIKNFAITAPGSAGCAGIDIGPTGAPSGVLIEDMVFTGGINPQVISLYTCTNVWINRCVFQHVWYCILQQTGYSCSGIKVTDCLGIDMLADFVAMNGAGGAGVGQAFDILIEGNTITGTNSYPTPKTEERFVSLTATDNVKILNNYVQHCAGDAPIHIEVQPGAESKYILVSGNTFLDCLCTNGNTGYVYLATNGISVIVTDNYFLQSNTLGAQYAVSNANNSLGGQILFANNIVWDYQSAHNLGGLDLTLYSGDATVNNNWFIGGGRVLSTFSMVGNIHMIGNKIMNCTEGIHGDNSGAGGGAGDNITVDNNYFDTSGYSIYANVNGSGTGPANNWCVRNNKFVSSAGAHNGVFMTQAVNCWGAGNWYGSNLLNTTIADTPGTATVQKNDFKQGTGLIHP